MSMLLPSLSVITAMYFISKVIYLREKLYNFTNPKRSALLSIVVASISVYLLSPIILILLRRYFSEVEGLRRVALELIFPITLLAPICLTLWLRKEPVSTLGLTSLNLAKSTIIGLLCSIVFNSVQ
jgi:hypothetical protein